MQFFIRFLKTATSYEYENPDLYAGPFNKKSEAYEYIGQLESLKGVRFSDRHLPNTESPIYRYWVFSDHEKEYVGNFSNFFHKYASKDAKTVKEMRGIKFDPYTISRRGDNRSYDYAENFRFELLSRKHGHADFDQRKDQTWFSKLLKQYGVPEFGIPLEVSVK